MKPLRFVHTAYDVSTKLEVLYAARNRIAHHEPIYGKKLEEVFEAINYIRNNFESTKSIPTGALFSFTEIQFYRLYIDFISFKNSWDLLSD